MHSKKMQSHFWNVIHYCELLLKILNFFQARNRVFIKVKDSPYQFEDFGD